MELRHLVRTVRRWWWLVLLGGMIGAAAGYAFAAWQQPGYAADAIVLIHPEQTEGSSAFDEAQASSQLAATYRRLVSTRAVLQPVIDQLDLPRSVDELGDRVSTEAVVDLPLLEIVARDPEPRRAAEIANAVAASLDRQSREQARELSDQAGAAIADRIVEVEAAIAEAERQVAELEQSPDAFDPENQDEFATRQARLESLEASLRSLQAAASTADVNAAIAGAWITLWSPAAAPEEPATPRTLLLIVLGALAGLMIAGGAVIGREFLDTSVTETTDVGALAGVPLLAALPRSPGQKGGPLDLFARDRPTSDAAEALRLLRAQLELPGPGAPGAVTISGAADDVDTSVVAANLAVTMARTGQRTVLIDADLQMPRLHSVFQAQNERGLSLLLTQHDVPWQQVAEETGIENLLLVPSGPLPRAAADLLTPAGLDQLMTAATTDAGFVVVATASGIDMAAPRLFAAATDGVLLVCRAGKTRQETLRQAVAAFRRGGTPVIGVVLTGVPTDRSRSPFPPRARDSRRGGYQPAAERSIAADREPATR